MSTDESRDRAIKILEIVMRLGVGIEDAKRLFAMGLYFDDEADDGH